MQALIDAEISLVQVPGGTFLMGSLERELDERPQHPVTIRSFLMGRYPVTQAQWRAVAALPQQKIELNPDPSYFKGEDRPVETVSWEEAVEFCARLSADTGKRYRLPTEAEWEYACRAGTTTRFHFGETITTDAANCCVEGQHRDQTADVGSFPPNAFGLYDMHGNVWEWCQDVQHNNYEGAPDDGSAWVTDGIKNHRVVRGGSWFSVRELCRSAYRLSHVPVTRDFDIGFRVVCE